MEAAAAIEELAAMRQRIQTLEEQASVGGKAADLLSQMISTGDVI